MMRVTVLTGLSFWIGATLVLSQRRWFMRRSLTERLRPYEPGGLAGNANGSGLLSVESFSEIIGPLARSIGNKASQLVGVNEDLTNRLRRVHSPLGPTEFRVRQLGWAAVSLVAGGLLVAVARPSALVGLVFLLGSPVLGFLIVEQQLASASDRRKKRMFLELPVVAEQLGMLLSAGFSLTAALTRIADRGKGVCGQDLRRVVARIRQGLTEVDALREWATTADLDALSRLVAVLALNREAGDLGRMIAEEARSIRREVQRELIEQIERRSQQVWIPVTVAALVPGAIFIAIPFIEALRAFGTQYVMNPARHEPSTSCTRHEQRQGAAMPRHQHQQPRIRRDERGEGVISTAIAVLVMAFLGAAMWVAFNQIWDDTKSNTERQVEIIGGDVAPTGG